MWLLWSVKGVFKCVCKGVSNVLFYLSFTSHHQRCLYRSVLEFLEDGSHLLDVGIGTGVSLINNKTILHLKKLKVTGVDKNERYLRRCCLLLRDTEKGALMRNIQVFHQSLLEHQGGPYDAVHFGTGFFSLRDDDPQYAIRHVLSLLKPGGLVVFTHTFGKSLLQLPSLFWRSSSSSSFYSSSFSSSSSSSQPLPSYSPWEDSLNEENSMIDSSFDPPDPPPNQHNNGYWDRAVEHFFWRLEDSGLEILQTKELMTSWFHSSQLIVARAKTLSSFISSSYLPSPWSSEGLCPSTES